MNNDNERKSLIVYHDVEFHQTFGNCYRDGVQTVNVCFVCRRHACKTHSNPLRKWVETEWRTYAYGMMEAQFAYQETLGLVCLDHFELNAKPSGFPHYRVKRRGKIGVSILCIFIIVVVIVSVVASSRH